jgi:hypothetical protein
VLRKALAAFAAAVVAVPVLFVSAGMGMFLLGGDEWPPVAWRGATDDPDMPPWMQALYDEAGAAFGVSPGLLAGLGKVECDHGRDPRCDGPNDAGEVGPMRLPPDVFARWASASGSATPDPRSPRDAVYAAAAHLAALGAASDPSAALLAYNHHRSAAYVATVEAWALVYGWRPPAASVLAAAVLDHPRIGLRAAAEGDVRAGLVDGRVLAVLLVAASRHDLGSVGPFVTGHSYYVAGTDSPSNHAFGRAVDLPVVDGEAVSPGNDGARALVGIVDRLPADLRPTEIGCPWADAARGAFTKAHDDHLHFGFDS